MYLKRIDINGFKSFADRVSLELSSGITGIVGPNGSGKSNIADAVRWVLGEQNARVLRGNKMEDIIFGGSEKRKRMSFGEVTLTFDNSDNSLPLENSEVAIKRRVYRDGESEYMINNTHCRMKDILELFYDSGIGREGYSIIGQGKLEQILSPRGVERREAFEDAAGVMKYKVRREEAQRKLSSVASDVLRINDIIGEIERSLDTLKIKSEKAKAFLELRDKLKALEVSIFLHQYEQNRSRVKTLEQNEQSIEDENNRRSVREKQIQADEELVNEKLSLTEKLLDRAKDKRTELAEKLQKISGEADLFAQRKEFFESERARLEQQRQRIADGISEKESELKTFSTNPESIIAEFTRRVDDLQKEYESQSTLIFEYETRLDSLRQKYMDSVNSANENKLMIARMETLRSQAQERQAVLDKDAATAKNEFNELQSEKNDIENAVEQIKARIDQFKKLENDKLESIRVLGAKKKEIEKLFQETGNRLSGALHRLEVQKELKTNFEGYAHSVRKLMQDIKTGNTDAKGVLGTAGSLIKVPEQFEKAIEQALGAAVQNVVTDNEETAKRLISHLRRNNYGRVTFLPISALKYRTFSMQERAQLKGEGVIGPACELLEFDEKVRPAVEYLLGRTLVVKDIDSGIDICRKSSLSFRCVTLMGDIVNSNGAMTGGSAVEYGIISRERLIQNAYDEVQKLKAEAAGISEKLKRAEQKYILLENEYTAAQKNVQSEESELAVVLERLDATDYQLGRAKERLAKIVEETERLKTTIEDAKIVCASTKEQADEEELKHNIDECTQKLNEIKIKKDEIAATLNEERLKLATAKSETAAQLTNRQRIEKEIQRLIKENSENDNSLTEAVRKIDEIERNIASVLEVRQNLDQQQNEIKQTISKLETEREALHSKIRALRFEKEEIAAAKSEASERKFRIKAQLERLEAEFDNMQNRIWEEYQLTYANALPLRKQMKYTEAVQEAESIKETLRAMDSIDPAAIQEYSDALERYNYLTRQRDDLEKAKSDLELLIEELKSKMETQFIEQFEIINKNFERIFNNLFQGGHAELVLQDKNNAMECGIDIIATPPGKKQQLITLLSGGEKALTAIAILLAMQELKATPFCILDEIDSSLDDYNLRLLTQYLKNYSHKTQFILITHRRYTMEAADVLYGIAMEEKGVSKMVSVKFVS